jgi:hypothetical protein
MLLLTLTVALPVALAIALTRTLTFIFNDMSIIACCRADLVVPFGYMLEEHTVCTGDGYQLGLFRIPHGAAALNSTERCMLCQQRF